MADGHVHQYRENVCALCGDTDTGENPCGCIICSLCGARTRHEDVKPVGEDDMSCRECSLRPVRAPQGGKLMPTPRMLLAMRALDAAEPHGVLWTDSAPQRQNNLNNTVAVALRKRGWIRRAPDYLDPATGPTWGSPWMLTDDGHEALSAGQRRTMAEHQMQHADCDECAVLREQHPDFGVLARLKARLTEEVQPGPPPHRRLKSYHRITRREAEALIHLMTEEKNDG